jgi:hypothetical protein
MWGHVGDIPVGRFKAVATLDDDGLHGSGGGEHAFGAGKDDVKMEQQNRKGADAK